jgi:hypothetical protein
VVVPFQQGQTCHLHSLGMAPALFTKLRQPQRTAQSGKAQRCVSTEHVLLNGILVAKDTVTLDLQYYYLVGSKMNLSTHSFW